MVEQALIRNGATGLRGAGRPVHAVPHRHMPAFAIRGDSPQDCLLPALAS